VRCLSCKYDLSHLTEHRCPECGRTFDPSDALTFFTDSSQRWIAIRRALISIILIYATIVVLMAIFVDFDRRLNPFTQSLMIAPIPTAVLCPFVLLQMFLNLRKHQ
jgi:predicted amidophosphoribosyltransferase